MKKLPFDFCGERWMIGDAPIIMGVVNVTPDSFSDGGLYADPETAIERAVDLAEQGADIIDIGGESTRPGSGSVPAREQKRRTIPVIEGLSGRLDVPISIDTVLAAVASEAIRSGATIINDVSGFHRDPEMVELAARTGAGVVLMHMRGTPDTMQEMTTYTDLVNDICDYFRETVAMAGGRGVAPEQLILDPGVGFAKDAEQCMKLIAETAQFRMLGRPILVGPSRKSFIGKILPGTRPDEREWGTAAAVACSVMNGADIVRVHDVKEMAQVAKVAAAIRDSG